MKRTELKRSTPLRRRVPVRKRNARRIRRLREKQFGPQAELCRTLPCCVCNEPAPSDPHHVKSRGAGGDDQHCVPLCRRCHTVLHGEGPAFWVRRKINVFEVMSRMRAMVLDAEQPDSLPVSPWLLEVVNDA